ncbi:antiviral reverse transcriptase Drt3b [Xanthomonas sp. WHRI 10064A]|uniref:antiviral reverse transcriptase Drt3b n=1 Tax=unclassified Xanthomonas TaxID=2643310 RepID=UPI002B22ACD2|nr:MULTISPECIES: antiviral reverse transcriptase Drt3b [unclassified Xanthomonas]MEA9588667.1 antiviral reverse transcriptase Drt3b [Xanthomonas sp. WHRI 10064B]MEA9613652.1 antiviral reverse transcriptase Drt3b [Xanthomonas sp. WHRI 10064A]
MPKLNSGYSKRPVARSVLTETLPYELPLFLVNNYLYDRLSSEEPSSLLAEKILGIRGDTIPCKFSILKKPSSTRELGIMHPAAQVQVSNFYNTYDEFMAQLCKRSSISLRYPLRAASRYFDSRFVNSIYGERVEADEVSFESQSSHSSSYFAYRKYAHIYKFYDSKEFLDLEQKYRFMLRIDISKCFSSIYTHSISWAVRGKFFGKKMKSKKSVRYFEDEFDKLMRELNWGETNGLLVGPEVSRIFCEIILQGVDVEIQSKIGQNVCVRRYMDDYFIFSGDSSSCDSVEKLISKELANFNLFLNENKRQQSESPLVTSLSIARQKVNDYCADLMDRFDARLRQALTKEGEGLASSSANESVGAEFSIPTLPLESAEAAVKEIRAISRQYSIEYSGLAAPALAVIGHKLNKICSSLDAGKESMKPKYIYQTQSDLASLLRICEFLYVSDVRSSTSNKVARIFLEISETCRRLAIGSSFVELQMLDAVRKALSVWRDASLLDVINSVIAVQVITTGNRSLTHEDIENVLGRSADRSVYEVSYLSTIAGLFLCSNRPKLQRLRDRIIRETEAILCNVSTKVLADTAFSMLLLDYLSCPYIPMQSRAALYQSVAARLFVTKGIDIGKAKGAIKSISSGVRFTDWSVTQGSFEGLRRLLLKTELRLAYD